jgi:transcriptional regulator with XRE-family HTH domain
MAKSKTKLSAQLRNAIENCGKSRYRVCKDVGISQTLMSRFMGGERGLSLDVVERLCESLNLELRESKRKGR